MAKKDDAIIKKLSALKPSIPTSTRAETAKVSQDDSAVVVKESSPGVIELMMENISAMEKIRRELLSETGNIQSVVIDSWRKMMFITYDIQKTNFEYITKTISSLIMPSSDKKDEK